MLKVSNIALEHRSRSLFIVQQCFLFLSFNGTLPAVFQLTLVSSFSWRKILNTHFRRVSFPSYFADFQYAIRRYRSVWIFFFYVRFHSNMLRNLTLDVIDVDADRFYSLATPASFTNFGAFALDKFKLPRQQTFMGWKRLMRKNIRLKFWYATKRPRFWDAKFGPQGKIQTLNLIFLH